MRSTAFNPARRLVVGLVMAALAAVMNSCGIFSPRDSATPVPIVTSDPLNFASILAGTNRFFTKLQYEDLFTEDFIYNDNNSRAYSKTELIQKLKQLPFTYDTIQVVWMPNAIWDRGDTINLTGLKYLIYLQASMTVPSDSGNADFIVAKDQQSIWHICLWRDIPLKTGKSFFAP